MRRSVLALSLGLAAVATPARADDEFGGATVIFARGASLYRTDPRGKREAELAKLPAKVPVRALRTDAAGTVLLADLGGKWSWMRLDGKATTLTELACADGPAQLTEDGVYVLCRAPSAPASSVVHNLQTGKVTLLAVPTLGARIFGDGTSRHIIWTDANGVWSAPAPALKPRTRVAADAPLRSFLASPDGTRGIAVYMDKVFENVKTTKPAEVLMGFALDGQAARRKTIKDGVPIEWSHDNRWVLVQDRTRACIMSAQGGEYKCFKGYTGASIASDGKWALVLGSRDRGTAPAPKKKPDKKAKKKKKGKAAKEAQEAPRDPDAEPTNEDENGGAAGGSEPTDDVEVPPPTGALALYRAVLAGPYTLSPTPIVKVIDGAAVWVPGPLP